MQFNIRTGNYSQAGKAAADDMVRSFAAARRNAPDYGKMAQQAQAIRSKVKQEGINAASAVTRTGIQAAGEVETHKIKETAKRGRDKSKRKAGALATAGKMFSTAGSFMGEKRTKREVGSEDSYFDTQIEKAKQKAADLREQADNVVIEPTDSENTSTQGSSTNTPTQPEGGTTSKIISSAQALNAGKGTAGKGGKYTQAEMTSFAEQAGFSPEQAKIMGAIGMGESGGNAGIDTVASGLDPNRSNEYSVGLFQINAQAHGDKLAKLGYTADDLRDPVKNAQVAKLVHDEVGGFTPWSVYSKGIYQNYL